jgi:hypothetical protein
MKDVDVVVFGTDALMSGQGITAREACNGQAKTMQEEAGLLKDSLVKNFGEAIKFRYVNIQSDEMLEYPQIEKMINNIRLPLTAINGEPKFHGGFPFGMIAEAVYRLLK